jgi:hypothetical protein
MSWAVFLNGMMKLIQKIDSNFLLFSEHVLALSPVGCTVCF